MKKILGIEIPGDLSALDNDALKALGKSLVTAAKATAAGEVDPVVLGEVKEAQAIAASAAKLLGERKEADANFAAERTTVLAEVDELAAAFDDEPAEGEGEGEGDEDEKPAEGEGDEDPAEGEGDEDKAGEKQTVTASGTPYRPKAGAIADASESGSDEPDATEVVPLGRFKATSGLSGHAAGEEFSSLVELAEALQERYKDIEGGGRDRIKVATLPLPDGAFTQLTGDESQDAAIFAGAKPGERNALTAAVCAPREQVYDSVGAVLSSTARPVKGSLMNYRPARGGVSVYPALKLADMDGDDGYGRWTRDDDEDENAEKVPALLPCNNSVNYDIALIWRALTITNMEEMTFPELVAAALNKLQTLQHRMAEVALLDAALSSVNTKTALATTTDFGASINLFSTIANAVAIYREEERLGDQQFDAWIPRWVFPALQIDLLRQKRTSGRLADRIVTQAEVNSALRDLGLDVTWTMDVATSWAPVPTFADGEVLPALPVDIDLLFSPKGNLRALDRGSVNLGVTNNVVRDNESNRRNRFTMWWETAEGLIDFGATNYHLNLSDVCLSGAQTADVTAITDCAAAS
jgi:hypothetical protein